MDTRYDTIEEHERVLVTDRGDAFGNERDVTNSFFEVSKRVDSPEMLWSWVEWFRSLNIPCAIVKQKGGYALWKKGEEVGRRIPGMPVPLWKLKKKHIVYSFGL